MIEILDLGYMAGLFDGEGTIAVCSTPTRKTPLLKIAAYNTDRSVLEPFLVYFGGNIYRTRDKRPKNKPFLSMWQCPVLNYSYFAETMIQYCREKEKLEKLQLVIDYAPKISPRKYRCKRTEQEKQASYQMFDDYKKIIMKYKNGDFDGCS